MDVVDQEKIFMEIYTECDNNNTNNVQVSVLLSFIAPYIDSNSIHFEDLKNTLDPTNKNPCIDKNTFLHAMINWTEKFKNEVDFNFTNNEDINRQSTPTRDRDTLRVEYDSLNLSNISAYSLTGSVLSVIDPNILQEQNNELQHQNKKLSDCLDDVKYQLTNLEEHNVSLQNEIERVTKNWQTDQKLIKTLQTKCTEYEREREEHAQIAKENKRNNENLVLYKRIKLELENRIKQLEIQNKTQIETIEKLTDLCNEKDAENEHLQKEIETRNAEMLRCQEREMEWREKCTETELRIKQFIDETNDLKNHIQSLESRLENSAPHMNSFKMENFEPGSKGVTKNTSAADDDQQKSMSMSLSPEEEAALGAQLKTSPHESLQSELSQLSTSDCFHSCEHRIHQLEDEVGKLYDQLNKNIEEIEEAKNVKRTIEGELMVARKEIETYHDKYNSSTADFQQLKIDLEAALKEKQQLQIENKQIAGKLAYFQIIKKNFKTQLNGKLNELTTFKKTLKKQQHQIESLEKERQLFHEQEEQINQLKTNVAFKDNEIQMLSDKMTEVKRTFAVLEEEVKDLKQTNCKLMNEICSLERAAKIDRKRNTKVDSGKINKLEEQLDEEKLKCQAQTSTISNLISEKQQLLTKLELGESHSYGKKKIETLESKLQKYRKQVTDLENQILCKNKDIHEMTAKHQQLDETFRKHHEEHAQLMAHMKYIKTRINSNKDFLKTTTYYTSDIWRDMLKNIFPDLNISNLLNVAEDAKEIDGPLQDEINLLNNQIHVTVILLKALAKIKTKMTISASGDKSTTCNNTIDIRKLYNPHESGETNNESFLSKLSPKRFFLKPPTLLLKSKTKSHFVFPPMSPECAQPEMTYNETPKKSALKEAEVKSTDLELNNNVPLNAMEKKKESVDAAAEAETEAKETTTVQLRHKSSAANSTFNKTYNDSFIEKILLEQRVEEPLEKIEDSQIYSNEGSGNSGSESVSSKDNDDDDDDDDCDVEVLEKKAAKKKLKKERKVKKEEQLIKDRLTRQVRSMSEGAAVVHQLSKDGDVMVFPNLQDNALDALGLSSEGDQPKERLTDEEIELKFQTLALAFSIDGVTIKDRLERQQRQRDQAEENLSAEIARFISAIHRLHPLCVDAETTELVTSLLDRLQLILQASQRISTSAEIFGSVQQEWRIAELVNLMLSHLRNMIKQRDTARRQFQVTKRMLQETTMTRQDKKPVVLGTSRRLTINTLPVNGRGGGGGGAMAAAAPTRRASIATITRPQDMGGVARRTSEGQFGVRPEPSPRPWDCRRAPERSQERAPLLLSRPSRLDINNIELAKIQEGSSSTESFTNNIEEDDDDNDDQHHHLYSTLTENSDNNDEYNTPTFVLHVMDNSSRTIYTTLNTMAQHYGQIARGIFNLWAADGTLHELCFVGTIVCFALATIFLCNLIMEIEMAREGVQRVPWQWLTWQEFCALFYTKETTTTKSGPKPH